jgi:DedD protein
MMAKQITDDEDRLKRQARRRLIGAVALTTAIVVVLPMVLDSEPKPVGQDIELRIPDKDKVGAFVPNIDLSSASATMVTLPASRVAAVSSPDLVSPPALQRMTSPVSVVPPVVVPAAVTPEIQPASSPAKSVSVAPPPKPEPVRHEAKSEPAKHETRQAGITHTEQGQSVPQSGFIVQIGAFSNAETAHSWQKNLSQQGFKAYTEKVGNKTRVRAGPYATREAATKARHKLEAKGLHSNIVELD